MTFTTKKPITVGMPYEIYEQVREAAHLALTPYESPTGAIQRYIIDAVVKSLAGAGITVELQRAPLLRHEPVTAPRGTLEAAQQQVRHFLALERKQGQYPPVAARMMRYRRIWEEEVARLVRSPPSAEELRYKARCSYMQEVEDRIRYKTQTPWDPTTHVARVPCETPATSQLEDLAAARHDIELELHPPISDAQAARELAQPPIPEHEPEPENAWDDPATDEDLI